MMRGLSGYVTDLSSELARLDRIFRGGILSVPGIPVFLGGCEDKTLTREVIEFGNWVKTTGEPFPAQTWETLVEGIIADNKGGPSGMKKGKSPSPTPSASQTRKNLGTAAAGRPLVGLSLSVLTRKDAS
jgi:hypothetical protein